MTNTSSRERAVVGVSSLALLLAVTSEELDISCQTEKWECGHAEPLSVCQHTPTAKKIATYTLRKRFYHLMTVSCWKQQDGSNFYTMKKVNNAPLWSVTNVFPLLCCFSGSC